MVGLTVRFFSCTVCLPDPARNYEVRRPPLYKRPCPFFAGFRHRTLKCLLIFSLPDAEGVKGLMLARYALLRCCAFFILSRSHKHLSRSCSNVTPGFGISTMPNPSVLSRKKWVAFFWRFIALSRWNWRLVWQKNIQNEKWFGTFLYFMSFFLVKHNNWNTRDKVVYKNDQPAPFSEVHMRQICLSTEYYRCCWLHSSTTKYRPHTLATLCCWGLAHYSMIRVRPRRVEDVVRVRRTPADQRR